MDNQTNANVVKDEFSDIKAIFEKLGRLKAFLLSLIGIKPSTKGIEINKKVEPVMSVKDDEHNPTSSSEDDSVTNISNDVVTNDSSSDERSGDDSETNVKSDDSTQDDITPEVKDVIEDEVVEVEDIVDDVVTNDLDEDEANVANFSEQVICLPNMYPEAEVVVDSEVIHLSDNSSDEDDTKGSQLVSTDKTSNEIIHISDSTDLVPVLAEIPFLEKVYRLIEKTFSRPQLGSTVIGSDLVNVEGTHKVHDAEIIDDIGLVPVEGTHKVHDAETADEVVADKGIPLVPVEDTHKVPDAEATGNNDDTAAIKYAADEEEAHTINNIMNEANSESKGTTRGVIVAAIISNIHKYSIRIVVVLILLLISYFATVTWQNNEYENKMAMEMAPYNLAEDNLRSSIIRTLKASIYFITTPDRAEYAISVSNGSLVPLQIKFKNFFSKYSCVNNVNECNEDWYFLDWLNNQPITDVINIHNDFYDRNGFNYRELVSTELRKVTPKQYIPSIPAYVSIPVTSEIVAFYLEEDNVNSIRNQALPRFNFLMFFIIFAVLSVFCIKYAIARNNTKIKLNEAKTQKLIDLENEKSRLTNLLFKGSNLKKRIASIKEQLNKSVKEKRLYDLVDSFAIDPSNRVNLPADVMQSINDFDHKKMNSLEAYDNLKEEFLQCLETGNGNLETALSALVTMNYNIMINLAEYLEKLGENDVSVIAIKKELKELTLISTHRLNDLDVSDIEYITLTDEKEQLEKVTKEYRELSN